MYTPRSTDSDYLRLKRQVKKLMTRKPLGWTSVSDGQTQFRGEDSVNIIGSGLVEGLLRIVGELQVEGTLTITGQVNGSGDITWTGTFTLTDGGTITVGSGGKITVEGDIPLTIGLTSDGLPGLQFGSGGRILGNPSGLSAVSPNGSRFVFAFDTAAGIDGASWGHVHVTEDGVEIAGRTSITDVDVRMTSLPVKTGTGLTPGLLWIDPTTKRLYVVTS